jgi:hypothetical protein
MGNAAIIYLFREAPNPEASDAEMGLQYLKSDSDTLGLLGAAKMIRPGLMKIHQHSRDAG